MRAPFPLVVSERFEKGWNLDAVYVVATTFTLGFEHMGGGECRVGGDADGALSKGGVVERVDGCECFKDAGDVKGRRGGAGEEAL